MRLPKDQAIAKALTFKHGGMTSEELGFLYDCCVGKVVIEVGSMVGMSSYVIASAASWLVCVDLWPDTHEHIEPRQREIYEQFSRENPGMRAQFLSNMRDHAGEYYSLRGISWEASANIPDHEADVVLIDADHSFESVKRDIAAYGEKVAPGGIMLFHDYGSAMWPGVKQAIESTFNTPPYKVVGYLAAFKEPENK